MIQKVTVIQTNEQTEAVAQTDRQAGRHAERQEQSQT